MLRLDPKSWLAGAAMALGLAAGAFAQSTSTAPESANPPAGAPQILVPPSQGPDMPAEMPTLRGTTAAQGVGPMDIGIAPPPTGEPGIEDADQDEPAGEEGVEGMEPMPLPSPGQSELRDIARPDGLVAVLRGLDKITARVTVVDAPIGKEVTFGKLKILTQYCHKRPPEETPEVSAFLQIDDVRETDPKKARVFSGWMFASSPALHGVEHPVYDVWLIDCKTSTPASEFGTLPKQPSPKDASTKRVR